MRVPGCVPQQLGTPPEQLDDANYRYHELYGNVSGR